MSLGGGDRIITNTGSTTTGGTNTSTGSSTKNPWSPALDELLASLQGLKGANTAALPALTGAMQGGVDTARDLYGTSNVNLGDVTSSLGKVLNGGSIGGITSGLEGGAGSALERMLSGTPDYGGLSGAIDAANAPILRDFNENLLPGLNQRANFLNNGTGGIKSLNRVLPELGSRLGQNAATLTNNERLRALSDQTRGLELFGSLQGQANGQALQAAGLFPELSKLGLIPSQMETNLAGLPLDLARDYTSSVLPYAGLGGDVSDTQTGSVSGTNTTTSNTNQKAPADTFGSLLGDGLTLASLFGSDGVQGVGGLLGGLGGGDLSELDISDVLGKFGSGSGGLDYLDIGDTLSKYGGDLSETDISGTLSKYGGAGAAALKAAGGLGGLGSLASAGAINAGLSGTALAGMGGELAAATNAAAPGLTAAMAGGGAPAAAGGGFGATAGAVLSNPITWAVGGLLAAGLVLDKNLPSSSPLDKFDVSSGGWTKGENFADTKFTPQELNGYYGPALKAFTQTGNVRQALAALGAPTNEREKLMAEKAYHLFSGTGNPMRQIAKARGFGEGEWTAGNSAKQKLIDEIKGAKK